MSRTEADIQDVLLTFIGSELLGGRGPDDLGPDDDLLGSGLVDSLGVMRLIAHIESAFGYAVPPIDVTIDHFMTVDRITEYLSERID